MIGLYLASVGAYAGKSVTGLAIGLRLRHQGLRVGYFKPLGNLPVKVDGVQTDQDALFIAGLLGADQRRELLCPVLYTADLVERALAGTEKDLCRRVLEAYQALSADRDVMLIGGLGGLSRGGLIHLSAPAVAQLLGAKVLLVARYVSDFTVEEVLLARELFGERMAGAILNLVPEQEMERLRTVFIPHLEEKGIPVLGALPSDPVLASVTVKELAEQLGAKVLCGEQKLAALVEHFVIGAMNVSSAIRYLAATPNKAVITGGDRADIQLAALQTPTRALILTGNLYPSSVILTRAQQVGVPVLLVGSDTLVTVEQIEQALRRLRVREQAKVDRARALLEEHCQLDRLNELLGLPVRQG